MFRLLIVVDAPSSGSSMAFVSAVPPVALATERSRETSAVLMFSGRFSCGISSLAHEIAVRTSIWIMMIADLFMFSG